MKIDMKLHKVAIVIPAFNESESIESVVSKISYYGLAIVVNDGSTDNTAKLAHDAGALVLSHEVNLGYDVALASGLALAVAEGFDFAITVDGDGQHEPARIESLLRELFDGADIVVGIRDKFQRVSEKIFASLASRLWGISDPLCGMKGYRLSKIKGFVNLSSYSSIGTELTIRAVRSGWNIRQVSVITCARKGKSRFGEGLYPNLLIFYAMLGGLFWARAYNSNQNNEIKSL
jgi:glycosyltransferase involved in cell wall biosynthesis